jgi:hypothetical protein
MLIDDGYTESLGVFRVRRFISSERKQFDELIKDERFAAARELLAGHISDPDGKRIPLELVSEEVASAAVSNPTESADLENLQSGMRLMLNNPRLALRPCDLCQKWWFDQDTGTIVRIGGQNLERPEHAPTACKTDRGCERGTPELTRAFSPKNQKAFDHWMNWRHVGCPNPHDAILRRNWMWFESLKENHGLREIRSRLSQPKDRGRSVVHGL